MPQGTLFHPRTHALCESYDWRPWAGYLVASKYELTHDREYFAVRNSAALFDVSPLYKYRIAGRDALRLLNRVMTRDISRCAIGQALYTTWCNDNGKLIEDGMVLRTGPDTFRVTAADPNWRWFSDNALGLEVTVDDITHETGLLALQGPNAAAILAPLVETDLAELRYFRFVETTLANRPVLLSRTGYTGDLGYELWVSAADALSVWDTLTTTGAAYGITPAGMLALDIARIEAGYVLADVDYTPAPKAIIPDQLSSPYEAGLGWTVKLDKPDNFIGRRQLVAEKERGSAWQLVGVEVDWPSLEAAYARLDLPPQVPHAAWRQSVPLYSGRQEAGYASSGCFSPLLKRYLVLATVRSEFAAAGTPLEMEITVEHMRRRAAAQVVPLPFYDPARKRSRPL